MESSIKNFKYLCSISNFKLSINRIVFFMLSCSIIVDLITGVNLINAPDSSSIIGIIYKSIFLLILYTYIFKLNRIVLISVLIMFAITIIASLNDSLFSIPTNIIATSKLLLFLLLFYYFIYLIKKGILNTKMLFDISKFTFIVVVFNQFLGLLGYGKSTYNFGDIKIGTAGFFFEINSYSYILVIITVSVYYYISTKINYTKKILFLLFCICLGISIATKVAIGGVIIISFIILWEKSKKQLLLLLLIGFLFAFAQRDRISKSSQVLYFMDKVDQDPNQAFYSDRDANLKNGITIYFEKYSYLEKFFGIGQSRMLNDKIYGGTAEMDYVDILRTYGLLGFIVIYFAFLWIIALQYRMYKKTHFNEFKITFTIDLFLLILSCLAGHLLTSGSVSIYLAIMNIYPFVSYKEYNNSYQYQFDDTIKIQH